ncbi:MAG: tetratricopeptide repeat protein [Bauldia sp.]
MTLTRRGISRLAAIALLPALASTGEAATDERPATLSGNYLAAVSAIRQRDASSASGFLSRALELDPGNPELVQQAFTQRLAAGNIAGTFDLARLIIATRPGDSLARTVLGIEAMRAGRFEEAKTHFDTPGVGPIAKLVSGILSAWAQDALGNRDAANAAIGALTGPDWYPIFKGYHQAILADLAGKPDEALRLMRQVYDPMGSGVRMAEAFARMTARAGNSAAAQKALLDYIARNGDHPLFRVVLDDITAGRRPDAIVHNAIEGAAELLYQLGVAVNSAGTEDTAASYLNLALYLNPASDIAPLALGDVWQAARNHDAAVAAYAAVPANSPLAHQATIAGALSLDALDRTDEAAAKLKALLAKDASDTQAATALGDIYRGRQRYAEAADAYDIAVKGARTLARSDWRLLFSRGISYERTSRWSAAELDFKKALELWPDQAQVLNYLGYTWVERNTNIDEALGMIRKAVDQRPDDGYIVDSLGWAYYKLGQYVQAATYLQRAILLQPEDPTINDHYGDALWQIGRRLEATFQWAHARDFKPEPDELARILDKLKNGLQADKKG